MWGLIVLVMCWDGGGITVGSDSGVVGLGGVVDRWRSSVWYIKARADGRLPLVRRARRWEDGKSGGFHRSAAAIPPMAASSSASVCMRCWTRSAASVSNGLVARLHGFSAVRFVSADAAEAGFLRAGLGA